MPPRTVATPRSYTPRHLAEKILAARSTLTGERKQVTVLFADVVGSTELIRDLDPEDAQRLLDGATQVMMDAVHRFEGTVSRSMGDGVMALFGAPIAHEDHAIRACYAALALQDGMRRYADTARHTYGVGVEARVGLNSGEVIVRLISDDLHMDYTAMGQTVHLAARMEQAALPGGAALTPDVLSLVEGYVQVRSLGRLPIKGLAEPLETFELVGTGALRTRLQVSAARGLTRFVGRHAELEALHGALERARAGHGQLAALVGEPGVGKSRLVWEVTHSHRTEGWTILESGSVSYGKATPWLPVIDLLRRYCRIESQDDVRSVREKVNGKLLTLDDTLRPAIVPLLALLDALPSVESNTAASDGLPLSRAREMMSAQPMFAPRSGSAQVLSELASRRICAPRSGSGAVGVGGPMVGVIEGSWEQLEPAQRRRQTLDAVKRLLLRESQEQPLLLVFEDLHWIDTETQVLLDSLVESLPTARILLLVNYRPEYRHEWGNRGYYTQLRIDPLGEESAAELLASLLGDDPSVRPLAPLLIGRTHGNPFFLEESVRTLVEQGALTGERGAHRLVGGLARIRVPPTVQAILAARIDRLSAEHKRLLQTAAVVGKDVSLRLLQAIADLGEDALDHGLGQLQLAEFLYEVSLFPEREYTFKHALTHEVTYGSLLQDRRKALHAQLLTAIERLHPGRLDEHVEQLAHHALRGELWEQAVGYCKTSADKATRLSAYDVVIERSEQAIAALARLPETRERLRQTFDLRLGLRAALGQMGHRDRALASAQAAVETATRLDDADRLGRALIAPTTELTTSGRHAEALALLEHGLAIAEQRGNWLLGVLARQQIGQVRLHSGSYRHGSEVLEMNIAYLDGDTPVEVFLRAGSNTHTPSIGRAFLAHCLAQIGELDRAVAVALDAVRLAEATGHPLSITATIVHATYVLALRGAGDRACAVSERMDLLRLPARSFGAGNLMGTRAWAYAVAGRFDDANALLDEWIAGGTPVPTLAFNQVNVAEALVLVGRLEEADELAHLILDGARARQERGNEARTLWLLAEIAARRDPADWVVAEGYYREALAVAEELEIRPLQARCHLGLGLLLRDAGRPTEARAELSLARDMLRDMGMTRWLPEAEAALADLTVAS